MKKGKFLSYQYYQIYNDMLSSLRKSLIFILFLFLSFQFIKITQAILPLDIEIDTGTIYFRGEIAEFYILTSYNGTAVDSLLTLNLYGPSAISISSLTHVATGLYKARFQIPSNALTGVYTLVVSAIYDLGDGNIAKGISLKSFLISDKLTSWDSKLISIENKIATIQTDIGIIKVNISNINASLISISGRIATIQTDIGIIKSDIGTINGKISYINKTLVAINTDLGMIETDLININAKLKRIIEEIAEIQTDIGIINVTLNDINAKIAHIEEDIATIQTDIGTIRGKIIRMEGNVMYIQTDLGEVKITIPKEFEKTRTSLLPPAYIAAIFAIIAVFILIFPFIKKKVKKKRVPSSHAES
jgi:predicted  nucleic acid-binding Zn-ribbon protein